MKNDEKSFVSAFSMSIWDSKLMSIWKEGKKQRNRDNLKTIHGQFCDCSVL